MTRRILLLTVCALAVFVAGCGNKQTLSTAGDTEGVWLDVGPLDYHVQGSRQLNPNEVPDDRYLSGVPSSVPPPNGRETWFAVFLRIENKTKSPAPSAKTFYIQDTEGAKYQPVQIDTKVNPFAYIPQTLGVGEAMPHPDSAQDTDSVSGAMLLFKLPLTGYQNRPLEFHIESAGGPGPKSAQLALDV